MSAEHDRKLAERAADGISDEYRSLTTDIAIVAGPTAAVVAGYLLGQDDKPGDTTINITINEADPPPPQEPEK